MLSLFCIRLCRKWTLSFISADVKIQFRASKKKICIAAHSTPFIDGMVLHSVFQQDKQNHDHVILVRGFTFNVPWCKKIIAKGFVSREINELRYCKKFCRILFPSGGNVIWKSGFHVLARELDADIIVLGIDYSTRRVVIDSILPNNRSFDDTRINAINRLRQYQSGPFCLLLRVLFGYGCATYNISVNLLLFFRILFFILILTLTLILIRFD